MATDYSKKKNVELEDLLRTRSLPHTGKKADLIARLVQHDKDHPDSHPTGPVEPISAKSSTATAVADEEIDWDDDAKAAAPKPTPAGAAAISAGGQGQAVNPAAVPDQVVATDPAATSDLTVKEPSATEPTTSPPAAPAADFAQGLTTTTLDSELEKRKARAARFGLPQEAESETVKALERAKRFGTSGAEDEKVVVGGLDSALPERVRKRGRDREDKAETGAEGEKSGKRQDSRRRDGRGRGRGRGRQGGVERSRGPRNGGPGEKGMASEKDRLAAEARKKRFAAAA